MLKSPSVPPTWVRFKLETVGTVWFTTVGGPLRWMSWGLVVLVFRCLSVCFVVCSCAAGSVCRRCGVSSPAEVVPLAVIEQAKKKKEISSDDEESEPSSGDDDDEEDSEEDDDDDDDDDDGGDDDDD